MNKSYSKIRHIQESNRMLEKRIVNEMVGGNEVQLVKDIIHFFRDMSIVPGPLDGAKLLYDLYKSDDPVQVIKDFVIGRIPTPVENWKRIEKSLEAVKGDASKFKNLLYSELKKNFSL
jgi:hypothetical protein